MTDKKAQLCYKALQHLQESGVHSLSFRTLADNVGIKSSSVHYYYPAKADLTQEIIVRYRQDWLVSLGAIRNSRASLRGKVHAFFRLYDSQLDSNKITLSAMLASERAHLSPSNRKLLRDLFADTEKWMTNLFSDYSAQLKPSIEPQTIAKLIIFSIEGAIVVDHAMQTR